ncbi:MAG: hypothetical protein MUC59_16885 [Saprospiraceae bacterium]|nr:hypothetical protein [Saprospiraceae bacterium]
MKKTLALLSFCLAAQMLVAQAEYFAVDSFASNFEQAYESPEDLAIKLTAPFSTEKEKARALYIWLTENFRYDVDKYLNPPKHPRIEARTKEEMEAKAKEWQDKQLAKSFKSKKGVCADYSKIYKAMCDAVGLEAAFVTGDARDFNRPYRSIHNNPHAWNAVKWDGKWHLIDATWGAGSVDGDKFMKQKNRGYFDTPPAFFAQNHLPDSVKWQLLEQPLGKKEFADQPLVQYGQSDYPVLDYSPTAEKNGKERIIKFKFANAPKYYRVLVNDTNRLTVTAELTDGGWVSLRFPDPGAGKVVTIFGGENEMGFMRGLAKYEVR